MTTAPGRPEGVPPSAAERTDRTPAAAPSIAIVVPTWNRAADAGRCLASLARLTYANRRTIVVDNGSRASERAALHAAASGAVTTVIELPENRGFAAAVNTGIAAAFAAGCDAVLVLNDDAEVDPGLLEALVAAAAADPAAGIVAPRIVDAESGREVSRGERVYVPLLCLPRTWLRVRGAQRAPYRVSGVLGAAFLVTRACWERVGALAEPFFAYYEEVEYWLRARAAGFAIVVVPDVAVRHRGFRGFAGGFTPLAAYLKARNLPLVVRRHGGPLDWLVFLPTYVAMIAASLLGYAVRGGGAAVMRALVRGMRDAWDGRGGPPPATLVPRDAA
jgi:GT2 family glycosyltransferase